MQLLNQADNVRVGPQLQLIDDILVPVDLALQHLDLGLPIFLDHHPVANMNRVRHASTTTVGALGPVTVALAVHTVCQRREQNGRGENETVTAPETLCLDSGRKRTAQAETRL